MNILFIYLNRIHSTTKVIALYFVGRVFQISHIQFQLVNLIINKGYKILEKRYRKISKLIIRLNRVITKDFNSNLCTNLYEFNIDKNYV